MAFVDTTFPVENLRLVHGIRKGLSLPTTVVGNSTKEYRIRKLSNYRTTWTWPARNLSPEDREQVSLFYSEVASFSLNSFKFKCPYLHSWALTPLLYTGSGNNFYLTTRGSGDTHPVFHLGNDVVVRVGSTPLTSGQWSKQIINGIPVINVPGHTSNINISGTFYHVVRFDQATMEWEMVAMSGDWDDGESIADALGDISLIEVFEY